MYIIAEQDRDTDLREPIDVCRKVTTAEWERAGDGLVGKAAYHLLHYTAQKIRSRFGGNSMDGMG